jgi:biotin transporter BioY
MKKISAGYLISFGFGSAVGAVIFDYFAHDSIDWFRALFIGVFVTISLIGFFRIINKLKIRETDTVTKN